MCIIAFKNIGVEMPSETVLKKCFESNSQGAGFAHYDPDLEVWIARKGFMTWPSFWGSLQHMQYQADDPVMMHFRISTSGKRSHPDCTHPFPISFDAEELNVHSFETENIVMHNGVVGPGKGDLSDTQVAIMKYIAPLFPFIEEPGVENILGDLLKDSSCRWLLARKDDIMMYGTWHDGGEDAPGVKFSNLGFKPTTVTVYNRGNAWGRGRWANEGGSPDSLPFQETANRRLGTIITNSGGSPPPMHDRTILVPLDITELKSNYIDLAGFWDWDKWDYENGTYMASNEEKEFKFPSLLINAPSLVEVFSIKGDLEAVVDENGNIMWSDGEWVEVKSEGRLESDPVDVPLEVKKNILSKGIDYEFYCPTCGNSISVRKLNIHGECCFCYTEVLGFGDLDDVLKSAESNYKCPNCDEVHRLVDSPFNIGDILCETCGAVFLRDTGVGEVVMYDYDIANAYKLAKQVLGA